MQSNPIYAYTYSGQPQHAAHHERAPGRPYSKSNWQIKRVSAGEHERRVPRRLGSCRAAGRAMPTGGGSGAVAIARDQTVQVCIVHACKASSKP